MNDKLMQVLVFAICVVGYVPLAMAGKATAEYVTLIGPVLAVVILGSRMGKQEEKLDQQDLVLNQIQENTNGILKKKIKEAVAEALAEQQPSAE